MTLPGIRLAAVSLVAGLALAGCGADDETDTSTGDPSATPTSAPISSSELQPVGRWLAGEVGDDGFVEGSYIDHGLTLDYATTLDGIGGHDQEVSALLDAMQDPREIEGYLSFYDEKKNGQYAGATAKLIHTVVTSGRDLADYRGDLVDDLGAMVVGSGPEAGRAKDTGPADYSTSVSQAYVVRALAVTGAEEQLDETTEFLLQQQCEPGWFRESLAAGPQDVHSCEQGPAGDRKPSVDSTAHAVQGLLEAGDGLDPELGQRADQAVDAAVQWLEETQGDDGGWGVSGAEGEPANANSTGLAVAALTAAGRDEAAATGAEWLLDLRVEDGGEPAGEAGAVPFTDEALAKARKAGRIKDADRPQWQRATVEAAAGMLAVTQE